MKEGVIENTRVKELTVGLTAFSLNIHGYFIISLLDFIKSLSGLLSDDILSPFISSRLMANYTKMIDVMSKVDKSEIKQDGKGGGA
jgi:hypothetical protein